MTITCEIKEKYFWINEYNSPIFYHHYLLNYGRIIYLFDYFGEDYHHGQWKALNASESLYENI